MNESTHEKGHTLDLGISSIADPSSCVNNIKVDSCGLSDHHCVHFEISTPKPGVIRKTIKFRKRKSMNINDFKVDIRASNITQKVASASSTEDKINVFNETISRIIDMHAPLVTTHIAIRPNTQWFNNDIREARKIQRAAEKR